MVHITEETVRVLAGFKGDAAPVTTCYLDVDGRSHPTHSDVQRSFDQLRRRLNGSGAHPSVQEDLARMERHVRGLDRSGTRGLAMFSCSAASWWHVHELPVPVTSQLVVNSSPSVRQLESIVEQYERFGVLLTDRQRARMFVFELGELIEHTEALDAIEKLVDDDHDQYKHRAAHQADEQLHQHLRRAARLGFELYQQHPFDRLLIGGSPEVIGLLEAELHPYLKDRIAERLTLSVQSSMEQVSAAAHAAEQLVERRNEAEVVGRLREAAGAKSRAVVGLVETLAMLNEHRVDRLVVSQGYSVEGWRCACGALATIGRRCKGCGQDMALVADVVDEAVEVAFAQHARVEVCVGNADLDVLGRIGALLRY